MKKVVAGIAALVLGAGVLTGCGPHQSDIASKNLSNKADKFQIARKITFYNGITGKDILIITGFCALGNDDPPKELTVICKLDDGSYIKNFLGLSDNVTYLSEQLTGAQVSSTRYDVTWIPQAVIPNSVAK